MMRPFGSYHLYVLIHLYHMWEYEIEDSIYNFHCFISETAFYCLFELELGL
ncbi:hypothetical protein HanRHA438_Chr06g0255761 [Helianthus annuus]|nr:hypothetical protein HanRHA438_Chr06g0255761 [Helianthus annuus]